jgi:hypothetical protein
MLDSSVPTSSTSPLSVCTVTPSADSSMRVTAAPKRSSAPAATAASATASLICPKPRRG